MKQSSWIPATYELISVEQICGSILAFVHIMYIVFHVQHRYQEVGDHDKAVHDYEFLCQKDPSSENRSSLREAKRLQKLAKRKDYYKILGISKGATPEEIKKAYRKGALMHHPDRHADADDAVKKKEEAIFKEVSEAYSILSDARKKARYDSGQDLEEMDMGMLATASEQSVECIIIITADFDPSDLFSNIFGFTDSRHGGGGMHFSFGHGGGMHFPF